MYTPLLPKLAANVGAGLEDGILDVAGCGAERVGYFVVSVAVDAEGHDVSLQAGKTGDYAVQLFGAVEALAVGSREVFCSTWGF